MVAIARDRLSVAISTLEDAREVDRLGRSLADIPGYSWLVACLDATVVGFAVVMPFTYPGAQAGDNGAESEVGNLSFLAADSAVSGMGIGEALLRAAAAKRRQQNGYLMVAHVTADSRTLYERAGWTVLPVDRGYAWQSPTSERFLADWADDPEPFVHFAYKKLRPVEIEFTYEHLGAPPIGRACAAAMFGSIEGVFDRDLLSPMAQHQFSVVAQAVRAQLESTSPAPSTE